MSTRFPLTYVRPMVSVLLLVTAQGDSVGQTSVIVRTVAARSLRVLIKYKI